MNKRHLLLITVFFFLLSIPVNAADSIPVTLLPPEQENEIPGILWTGMQARCGNFSIKLLQDPVLVKSTNYMISPSDTKYLIIRLAVTNIGSETEGWLSSESFIVQDTYRGRIYGTYKLNITISAKVSVRSMEEAFFAVIEPGKTVQMDLAFSVYPDVESWVFTFAPQHFGGEPEEIIRFRLPRALTTEE